MTEFKMALERIEKGVNKLLDAKVIRDPDFPGGHDTPLHDPIIKPEDQRRKNIEDARKTGSYARQLAEARVELIRSLRETSEKAVYVETAIPESNIPPMTTHILDSLCSDIKMEVCPIYVEIGRCSISVCVGCPPHLDAKFQCDWPKY
jgi:hypothetical protein